METSHISSKPDVLKCFSLRMSSYSNANDLKMSFNYFHLNSRRMQFPFFIFCTGPVFDFPFDVSDLGAENGGGTVIQPPRLAHFSNEKSAD